MQSCERYTPCSFTRRASAAEVAFPKDSTLPDRRIVQCLFVTDGVIAFDHHGYSLRNRLLTYHTNGWATRSPEGWNCRLERVSFNLLDRRDLNDNKMLGPDQYLHDPIARAETYLGRVNHVEASARARAKQLVQVAI
jgi:hypothetical protein